MMANEKGNAGSPNWEPNLSCPSYVCKPGAQLFGIVNADGGINYLHEVIPIDSFFVEQAHKGRQPEKRFRFAGACAQTGCKHWDYPESQCGLVGELIELWDADEPETLQPCAIRPTCRWFAQRGGQACATCTHVIRNPEIQFVEDAIQETVEGL